MSEYELAQLNVARMAYAMDSEEMRDFVESIERINALAEAADGFVWRLQTDESAAPGPFGPDCLVNVSVWRDVEALRQYVYQSAHVEIMKRRREWFSRQQGPGLVLWWVSSGTRPDEWSAKRRLDMLEAKGPSREAFTFGRPFESPGT